MADFNYEALLSNPLFQIGLGLLSQQRYPGENALGGLGRGINQGLSSLNDYQIMMQRKAMLAQQQQAQQARQALVENIRSQVPKPRPLAFEPQPGDEEVNQKYQQQQMLANAVASGMNGNDLLALMNAGKLTRKDLITATPGTAIFDPNTNQPVFTNPALPKEDTGASRELADALAKRNASPEGSATWKMWDKLANKIATHQPPVTVQMPTVGGIEVMPGPDGRPHRFAVQVGRSGEVNRVDLGEAAAPPKEKSAIDKLIENTLANTPMTSPPAVQPVLPSRSSSGKIGAPKTGSYTAEQEAWIGRAMRANPGMSREQVIAEGKRLGKF